MRDLALWLETVKGDGLVRLSRSAASYLHEARQARYDGNGNGNELAVHVCTEQVRQRSGKMDG